MAYDAQTALAMMKATALSLMKTRLNRLPEDTSQDEYLSACLEGTVGELAKNGIVLTQSAADTMLLVDAAVWQYQNRDKAAGMPEWLRLRRRERWIGGP